MNNTKYFLEKWYDYSKKDSQKPFYSDNNKTYSRLEVELQTGKIFNYLKKHNIGKDDFVMVNLERGARSFISMFGIVKAGAAFVVVEDSYPKDRIQYIYHDLNCKISIDDELYKEIENEDYVEGYNFPDDHDAAYAVYTSGTTGRPKGVIHEYGNFKLSYNSELTKEGIFLHNEDSRFAITAPLNFIATILIFNYSLYSGGCVFIPPYDVIKNPRKLIEYYTINRINQTFLAPSLIRYIGNMLNPEMELVITGSEKADGLSINHGKLLNYYLMSEVGFVITKYDMDSSETPCPIGKPNDCVELKVNENGELLVKNEFFRGYVNDEELTKATLFDGYYHTGDAVKIDESGNYILTSRLTDMFKVNGNRVEPQEIEKAAESIIGSECVCKYFNNNGSSSIVLYYTGNKEINHEDLIKKLEEKLPYYMIPSIYEHIDAIPRTAMGKLDRKVLTMPDKYKKAYVEPRNELEARFCKTIEKVLNVQKFGIQDDFYNMGGDSMKTIELIGELDLEGLEAKHFFLGRTVEKTIELYKEATKNFISEEEKEMIGRNQELYTGMVENYIIKEQLKNPTTAQNLNIAYRMSKLINIKKLQKVLNMYIKQSSMFSAVLKKNDEGKFVYKYAPELLKEIEIEKMSEKEVEELRKSFVQPYEMLNSLLWRIRLVKTLRYNYLFLDIHHVLVDGTGMQTIGEDIANLYFDKPLNRTNNLFAFLYDKNEIERSKYYKDCIEYEKKMYEKPFNGAAPIDPEAGKHIKETSIEIDTGIRVSSLTKYLESKHITRTAFFISGAVLNAAINLKTANVKMVYLSSSRFDQKNNAGNMVKSMSISSDIRNNSCIEDLYVDIKNQMINHAAYSALDATVISKTNSFVIDDLMDIEKDNPLMSRFVTRLNLESPNSAEQNEPSSIDVLQFINNNQGTLTIRIRSDVYRHSVEQQKIFLNQYIAVLKRMLNNDPTLFNECLRAVL